MEVLDVLRGLALFGIIAANMRAFSAPLAAYFNLSLMWNDPWNRNVQDVLGVFVLTKFITLFSFLFGIGFAIQMSRAKDKGVSPGKHYARRLLVLFLLGMAHGFLLWSGDILAPYALMGAILYLFRKRTQKTVLIWSVALFMWPFVPSALMLLAQMAGAPVQGPPQPDAQQLQRIVQVFSQGTYAEIFSERLKELAFLWMGIVAFYPRFLGVFLFGLYCWRSGLIENLSAHAGLLRKLRLAGLAVGLPLSVTGVVMVRALDLVAFSPSVPGFIAELATGLGTPFLSLFYASSVALLMFDEKWRKRLHGFAAVGRTALSNYLLQSILCTLLFYSWGFGLYGKAGPAWGLVPTFSIYFVQVLLSIWWVRRFRFGPVEWVWRTLTYARRQPMRLAPRPAGGAAPLA